MIFDNIILLTVLLVELMIEDLLLVFQILVNNLLFFVFEIPFIVLNVSNKIQSDSVLLQGTHVLDLAKGHSVLVYYV